MGRRYEKAINAAVKRLCDGELYVPIDEHGSASQRLTLQRLEKLRLTLLASEDAIDALDRKNKTATASMVHDLKTPLAVISGYAESLQDGIDDKDYLALIQEKTAQMNEMVQGLVDASRQELQASPERREKVDARHFLLAELKKYDTLAANKHITVKKRKIPSVPLRINRQEIGRVIQNIISNAVKYTKEGGNIKVSYRIGNRALYIRVKDNGVGIDKESIPLVFDKFYREDQSRTTANSGLGLYIAKEIVEKHGGSVSVKSKKGKGSTFTVKLPIESEPGEILSFSQKFDRLGHAAKFFAFFFGGFMLTSVYRIMKFTETYSAPTLIAGIFNIALFPFAYFIDLVSIALSNKITFLAD